MKIIIFSFKSWVIKLFGFIVLRKNGLIWWLSLPTILNYSTIKTFNTIFKIILFQTLLNVNLYIIQFQIKNSPQNASNLKLILLQIVQDRIHFYSCRPAGEMFRIGLTMKYIFYVEKKETHIFLINTRTFLHF